MSLETTGRNPFPQFSPSGIAMPRFFRRPPMWTFVSENMELSVVVHCLAGSFFAIIACLAGQVDMAAVIVSMMAGAVATFLLADSLLRKRNRNGECHLTATTRQETMPKRE